MQATRGMTMQPASGMAGARGCARLHGDGLGGVRGVDELEVLDAGQLDAPPEVEAPASQALVPVRRLVAQLHAPRAALALPLCVGMHGV